MLNKEKYAQKLAEILIHETGVGISKKDNKPGMCGEEIGCADCIRHSGLGMCSKADLLKWANSEYKKALLTNGEKEYLRTVIEPFRKKISYITKATYKNQMEYICIKTEDWTVVLASNKTGTTYEGMEPNKYYTVEELGL